MAYRSIDITQINAGNVNNGKTILVQGNTFVFSDSAPGNTSNITEGTNLYFTNARVYANVIGLLNDKVDVADLTTSNVAEGSNLYFTNTRAVQAFIAGTGITIESNGLISSSAGFSGNTDAVPEGTANLYFTNARARSAFVAGNNIVIEANGMIIGAVQGFSGNTNVVSEGSNNLYFTNTRVVDAVQNLDNIILGNIIPKSSGKTLGNITHRWKNLFLEGNTLSLGNLYLKDVNNKLIITTDPEGLTTDALDTGNVVETTNLYYTNARVYANVIGLLNEKANITDLTTANVTELTNLYFTNARVYANVIGLINAKANITDLTTSNVAEGSNLYFTNSRSRSAIVAGSGISYDVANGIISSTGAASTFTGNTDGVSEGVNNLYYNNTRVSGYLASGQDITVGGNLIIEGNLKVTGNIVSFDIEHLSIEDNMIYLNANSNVSNPDLGFAGNYNDGTYRHAGFFRDATDGVWKIFDQYTPEPDASDYIDTSHASFRLANLAVGYITGNVIGRINSLAGLTTDNLNEGSANLYFTNARARSAFVAGNNISIEANGMIVGASQSFSGNTDVVAEGSNNLYYTNARVYANVIGLLTNYATLTDPQTLVNKTLANVHHSSNIQDSSGTSSYTIGFRGVPQNPKTTAYTIANSDEGKHIYYTGSGATITIPVDGGTTGGTFANGAVIAIVNNGTGAVYVNSLATIKIFGSNQSGNITLAANGVVSLMKVSANLWYASGTSTTDSDSILEGTTNLYFTNARARSAFVAGNNIVIEANGMIVGSVQSFSGNTNIVPEGSANLYFTNARAISAFTAGTGITIAANGLITGTAAFTGNTDAVLESASNLYYTNARVYANVLNITTLANKTLTNVHHSSNIQDSLGTNTYVIGYRGVPQNPKNAAYTIVNADEGKHIYYTGSSATLILPVDGDTSGGNFANGAVIAIVNGTGNKVYVNSTATIRVFGTNQSGNITLSSNGIVSLMKVSANVWYASGTNTTDTDSISEGTTNLYFTNARAVSAFTAGTGITIAANGLITGTAGFTGNTNSVPEGSANLYYTNARVYANVIGLINAKANITDLTTANVTEVTNLYFTNARVYANVIGLINAKANITDLTTSNVTEGTNLYFTNARVATYINQFVYASNIRENGDTTSGNVYFTNARARAAFTAGNGITIAANGMIVSTATGSSGSSSVLTLNESQTIQSASNSNVATYALTTSVTSAANILVAIDGLIQIPTTDYTVSGSALTFNEVLPANSNIEVKYFGVSGSAIDARGYFSKNIDQSVGYAVSNTLAAAVTFPSGTNEYIVHSVYVTNIDANLSTNVAITARFDFSQTGANVIFAYQMPVDARGSLELLKKPQIMNSNDRIMLQAFDNGIAANSNVLHAIVVYETRTTTDYVGTGANISTSTSNVYVSNNSPTIIESIRLVNTSAIGNTAVTVSWTDANGVIQSYLCFGMIIPTNASVELCETPKRIASNHMIRAFASGNSSIGLFVSGRTQL